MDAYAFGPQAAALAGALGAPPGTAPADDATAR